MESLTRRALFSSAFREAVEADPVTLVDVGARGGLEEPWRSLPHEALDAWRNQPEHRATQHLGRERFFARYRIEVCETVRSCEFEAEGV